MTPEICLISVPHSGTMFMREIFVSNGWQEQPLNGRPNGSPMLYQGHVEKSSQCVAALELSDRMPIVMPLRHPYRVEESWKRRQKDLRELVRCYINMLDGLGHVVSVWFPLDADPVTRSTKHGQLNRMANKTLHIDYDTLVNAEKGTHALELATLDPSPEIRKIREDPLFVEIYGSEDG